MASACFSFGRRFPGLAGAECLSEGDFTEPGWRTDYGGGKGRKNSAERGMVGAKKSEFVTMVKSQGVHL